MVCNLPIGLRFNDYLRKAAFDLSTCKPLSRAAGGSRCFLHVMEKQIDPHAVKVELLRNEGSTLTALVRRFAIIKRQGSNDLKRPRSKTAQKANSVGMKKVKKGWFNSKSVQRAPVVPSRGFGIGTTIGLI